MIQFDIILVSDANDTLKREMTQNCIDSIFKTQDKEFFFKVIVVEANKMVEYQECLTLHYDFEFNYNRCLNLGLKHSMARYKGLCNNDLVFHYGWAVEMVKAFDLGYGSASPYCMNSHPKHYPFGKHVYGGYHIGKHIAGWAIFITDATLEAIGALNEGVSFWYSDNIYGEQIKHAGVKHALVCSSFVTHLGSSTLRAVRDPKMKRRLTTEQKKSFEVQKNIIWRGRKVDPYSIKEIESDKIVTLKK